MPVSAGATLVRADTRTVTAVRPQVAVLSHGIPVTLSAAVHTSSESSPFIRSYSAVATTVATLARAVTRTLSVSNPPAAVLNKQAQPILTVAEVSDGTLVELRANFVNVSASVVTVATHVRAKLVTLITGYLNALPPAWVSAAQNATLVSRRTPSLLATQAQTGLLTKGISYHLGALATAVGTLTRQAVAHTTSLLATQTTVATLAQLPLRSFLASQPQSAATKIGYPRTVTGTAAEQAFLAWLFLPSTTPVLDPLNPGALVLDPTRDGRALFPSGNLFPGTFIYPSLGLSLTVSVDGTLTLEPL